MQKEKLLITLLCGGPSLERGISLNSARSVMDHLLSLGFEVIPIYVSAKKEFYRISKAHLYSNTPSDFDFKLRQISRALSEEALVCELKKADIVFPIIHGAFGEDGGIQTILEKHAIPFIGPSSKSCKEMFSKHLAKVILKQAGLFIWPSLILHKGDSVTPTLIEEFFQKHWIQKAIVKPSAGGSSIGVSSVSHPQDALEKIEQIFEKNLDDTALLEPFCTGKEFTIVLLEDENGPFALIPTEIELSYDNHSIFDYRKKYLPSTSVFYHTPSRFPEEIIQKIRSLAEKIYKLFSICDFARIDGWVMPNGDIYFTDINPISGMEQNSFFFRQTSAIGLTHQEALLHVIKNALKRHSRNLSLETSNRECGRSPVFVVFGGKTAERQVSLMSGSNVWLKLLNSKKYDPKPFLLDKEGFYWQLPYPCALNHTVEEVFAHLKNLETSHKRVLQLMPKHFFKEEKIAVTKYSLEAFKELAKKQNAFIFLALHGGEGEDGTLQKTLDESGLLYSGSSAYGASIAMDKYVTTQVINALGRTDLYSLQKQIITSNELKFLTKDRASTLYQDFKQSSQFSNFIIKPRADGCSAGIVVITSAEDLYRYALLVKEGCSYIEKGIFKNQHALVEMPPDLQCEFILEPYIETDSLSVDKQEIIHHRKQGWLELTAGILENDGIYHSLNPSITVAEGAVLSLEEKFQGGTGINITPPPEELINSSQRESIKQRIEVSARALEIKNYARIDLFYNLLKDEVIIIEANSLPALTPSTVLYHQALAEEKPLYPTAFLEHLIDSKLKGTKHYDEARNC